MLVHNNNNNYLYSISYTVPILYYYEVLNYVLQPRLFTSLLRKAR